MAHTSICHSTREVCSCTASATLAAMNGSDAAKIASSVAAPATTPDSADVVRPRRRRQRNTPPTTSGAMAFTAHVPARHSVG